MKNSFDPEMVRILASILADTGLTEIELTEKDSRIRVVRAAAPVMHTAHVAAPPPAAPVAAMATAPADDSAHPGVINSPMVGVAYLAPEPGATPYITVGQQVSAGQTLLLIEAMKTFNQVKALRPGTITRILIASGAPVEYGEPLLILE